MARTMAQVFENDGGPMKPGDVDGAEQLIDELDDDRPTWDLLRDPVPDYGVPPAVKQ